MIHTATIHTIQGPNYWSDKNHNLIVAGLTHLPKSDLYSKENLITQLYRMMPSLHDKKIDRDALINLSADTFVPSLVELIAVELQCLAGIRCRHIRPIDKRPNASFNLILHYVYPEAAIHALEIAICIIDHLVHGTSYNINGDIRQLSEIKQRMLLGPTTASLLEAARKRNIPYRKIANGPFILGHGANQRRIDAAITSNTSCLAADIAGDKDGTKILLDSIGVPVPKGFVTKEWREAIGIIDSIGFPIVIKPLDGNQGRGIKTHITDMETAEAAFALAKQISPDVILEKHVMGNDYRVLVIDNKFVAAAMRTPAHVKGNGINTIDELVTLVNSNPLRGSGHNNILSNIVIDDDTIQLLKESNLSLDSVPDADEIVFLKSTANLSTGGTATDVTDKIHPYNVALAERISRVIGLDICGIDVVSQDIGLELTYDTGGVVEVNASPGLRMHIQPTVGVSRDIGAVVMDMLYPKDTPSRIPIIAVTGTNGKTTTTRLIAHLAKTAGYISGFTCTDGVYINGKLLQRGDCAGPYSAQGLLADPYVNFAVLECARGGILKYGLGFDKCDISVVTNVGEDHLGLMGIDTKEQIADVKVVVPKSTSPEGYSILNADDDLVYAMRDSLKCKIALFSSDANNQRLTEHYRAGGLGITVEEGNIVLYNGPQKIHIINVADAPVTLNGAVPFMVKNIMPAVLAAYIQGFSIETIRQGLQSFLPTPEYLPGRMNVFQFPNFSIMVDYAHNGHGYSELEKVIKANPSSLKIGIVAGTGDRRDADIRYVGEFAAKAFDRIIIRHDKDLRGRSKPAIEDLIKQGIEKENGIQEVTTIDDEKEAIQFAMHIAPKDSLIVVCTDEVHEVGRFLQKEVEHLTFQE